MNYFYKGIPLREYCRNNNLDYRIYERRYRRLYDKKVPISKIENIIFNEYEYSLTTEKYYYNDIPLAKYCRDNKINYYTVIKRIRRLLNTKKFADLEMATKIAINEDLFSEKNRKIKYFYKGMILRRYCLSNNLDYKCISNRIRSIKQEYNNLSDDEIVKLAMENELNFKTRKDYRSFKYYYNDMPLCKYCSMNGINYNTIKSRIHRLNGLVPACDLIRIVLDDREYYKYVKPKKVNKYRKYKGMTLKRYCILHNIDYVKVFEQIYNIEEIGTELSEEEVILLAINRQDNIFVQKERIREIENQSNIKDSVKVLKKI